MKEVSPIVKEITEYLLMTDREEVGQAEFEAHLEQYEFTDILDAHFAIAEAIKEINND